MDKFERKQKQEFERLREYSHALEEEAGISKEMEDAHYGSLFPPGCFGEESTSEEYFEDVERHLFFKTRSLYFSVNNPELRKKLITTKRKIDTTYQLLLEEDVMAAKHDVAAALARAKRHPWLKLASYSLVVAIVGWLIFGTKGTAAGIVFALFFYENEKEELAYELSQAQEALQDAQKTKAEELNTPKTFTANEEQNGTEDIFEDKSSNLPLHYATGKLRSTKL